MLSDFLFCVNIVMPLFLVIGVGYLLRCRELLDGAAIRKLNTLVFNCTLPVMLFRDISRASFTSFFDPVLLLYCGLATLISCFSIWGIARLLIKEKGSVGAFVQGCFRSNYAILGLVLISAVMGDNIVGKGALVTTFVIPIYNILAIVVLSVSGNDGVSGGTILKSAVVNIARNPLILAILAGLPFSFFDIKIPVVLNATIDYLAAITTPLALLAIGGSLDFKEVRAKLKLAVIAAAIKLVIIPLVFVSVAIVCLRMRGEDLLVVATMCGSPTAVSSYIMASQMGADDCLAANIILLSTLFSAVTYTLGLYFFRVKGYI